MVRPIGSGLLDRDNWIRIIGLSLPSRKRPTNSGFVGYSCHFNRSEKSEDGYKSADNDFWIPLHGSDGYGGQQYM